MWCSDCQQDFPTVESAEIQVCPRCSFAAAHGKRSRRVPKLNPDSTQPKFRIDSAHQPAAESCSVGDDSELLTKASRWIGTRSMTHMAVFGLLVFLCGQAMLTWAFLVGHFVAWSIANLVSVVGIVVAIVSVAVSLRRSEQKIAALAQMVGRRESGRRKRSKVQKSSRPSDARK